MNIAGLELHSNQNQMDTAKETLSKTKSRTVFIGSYTTKKVRPHLKPLLVREGNGEFQPKCSKKSTSVIRKKKSEEFEYKPLTIKEEGGKLTWKRSSSTLVFSNCRNKARETHFHQHEFMFLPYSILTYVCPLRYHTFCFKDKAVVTLWRHYSPQIPTERTKPTTAQ